MQDLFINEAERLAGERRATDAAWLTAAREQAVQRFRELGLPTTRDEEWRFTSVAPIAETRFAVPVNGASSVHRADVQPFQWDGDRAATLVFVNGRYHAAASDIGGLPAGVRTECLAAAWSSGGDAEAHLTRVATDDRRAFTALNTALLSDGAIVVVPDRTVIERPIHLVFLSVGEGQPTMTHPRVLVVIGASSQATVVESYAAVGAERYLTNAVTEIVAAQNATLTHYKVQREHPDSFHMGAMYLRAAR